MAAGNDKGGNGYEVVLITVFAVIFVVLMWLMWHAQIAYGLLWVAEKLMIPPRWYPSILPDSYIRAYNAIADHLNTTTAESETLSQLATLYRFFSMLYYWAFAPVVLIVVIALWRRPVAMAHIGRLSIEQLVAHNSKYYPQIRPAFARKKNLLQEDPDKGPFARALSYRQMAEKHGLLVHENGDPVIWHDWYADPDDSSTHNIEDSGVAGKPRITKPYPALQMSAPKTRRIMSAQLGKRWAKHENLPVYIQGLYGVMVARVARDKEAADAAMFEMNATWLEKENGKHKMKCKKALALAYKHENTPAMRSINGKHAHTNVFLSALLELAQERAGVFPSAMFLWVKVLDRDLWYALNQVGRKVAWPEAAGVRAHLLAERAQGHAIEEPVVEAAIRVLAHKLALEGYLARDEKITEVDQPRKTSRETKQKDH